MTAMSPPIQPTTSSRRFAPFSWRGFRIEVAEGAGEVEASLRLRHQVFCEEGGAPLAADGLERDDYDAVADHVLIRDQQSGEVIGSSRFISSDLSQCFYSQSEFDLSAFLALPGVKVEMGRTCLAASCRNNMGVLAIGQALAAYARAAGAVMLFGCTSISTLDPVKAAGIVAYLTNAGALFDRATVAALPSYRESLPQARSATDEDVARSLPPLLRGYLRSGAQFGPEPAFDRVFQCIDFFTVLELSRRDRVFMDRYAPC